MGYRVQGSWRGVWWGSAFGVWGVGVVPGAAAPARGSRVQVLGFRVQVLGFGVRGLGFWVLGFRVWVSGCGL